MKQNVLIVLLTAAVVLLGVNLLQGRLLPTAQAGFGGSVWTVCEGMPCWIIKDNNEIYSLNHVPDVRTIYSRRVGKAE